MASQSQIANGQIRPASYRGEYNKTFFAVQQLLAKMQTATLVQIVSCTNQGGLSAVGVVDVVPMVNQLDGQGNPTPHVTIYGIPYFRIQGGANGIIIDPEPGDIGICVFASRDISKVKSTKSPGNPGSFRQYSFSDGLYMGGVLNGIPAQYVQFNSTGIKIHSPALVNLDAPDVQIHAQTVEINAITSATITTPLFTVNGATALNGTLTQGKGTAGGSCSMLGPVTVDNNVTGQGTSLHTHTHRDTQAGTGSSGVPN